MYMETVKWPDGKRCAVSVTVNLAAERFWLELDPSAVNMPKTLSMGQYGMTRGIFRVLDVLKEKGIKATFFVPGQVAETYPETVRFIAEQGHELACHGNYYQNMALLSLSEQEKEIKGGIEAIQRVAGVVPRGFRAPAGELTVETLRLAQDLGLEYSSDLSDDDRPYFMEEEGLPELLQIPIHWAMYDLPYFAFNYHPAFPAGQGRIAGYEGVLSNWEDELAGYYERGLCLTLQVDPQTIGNPGRIGLLEEFLDRAMALKDVWFPTCGELCDYFASCFPRTNRI